MIDDGVTGIGFDFNDFDGLVSVLSNIANHPDSIIDLKTSCIKKARQYEPEEVIQKIQIGGGIISAYSIKNLIIVSVNHCKRMIKLCTFSRVMKEKGIEEAVEATKILNDSGIPDNRKPEDGTVSYQ